jgi:hypothetical protein
MKLLRKIEYALTSLAMVPLSGLEKRERDRRIEKRLRRCKEKQKELQSADN